MKEEGIIVLRKLMTSVEMFVARYFTILILFLCFSFWVLIFHGNVRKVKGVEIFWILGKFFIYKLAARYWLLISLFFGFGLNFEQMSLLLIWGLRVCLLICYRSEIVLMKLFFFLVLLDYKKSNTV